ILRHHFVRSLWLAENTKPFEKDPRVYSEYISESVFCLFTQSTLPKEQNVANAAGRIAAIPAVIAAAKQNLANPPKQHLETAILQNRGSIGFYETNLFQITGESPQFSPLAEPARKAAAVLKDYQQFLETEVLPHATGDWRLGREKFARK